ncbi:MAG: recombinase family protein [Oscillospiraceae bacterium]
MIYGYSRVSTKSQAKDGNSLEAQTKALTECGAQEIFADSATGKNLDRPQFEKLLSVLQSGDTLVVTKLDRFARTTGQASDLISSLIEKGVRVHVINIGIMDNTGASTLIRNIFLSFAQFERDMILERTREGKAIARQSPDYREGRPPKYKREQLAHALSLLETHTYRQVERMTGISKSTLIRAKN